MIISFLLACSGEEKESASSIFDTVMSDYHGLSEGASWTYRDDSPENIESNLPQEFNLLRVRHETDGLMSFRRGSRWVDSAYAGQIEWDYTDGLTLISWSLPGGLDGTGPLKIADERPDENSEVSDANSTCVATELNEHETWFGTFDLALQVDCMGNDFNGSLIFGKDVGLIQLEIDDYSIDLVAPW